MPGNAENGIYGASCLNCCAFILILYIAISPYYLWAWTTPGAGWSNVYSTFGTGSFIAAATTTQYNCGAFCGIVSSQWLYWSEISSELACDNTSNPTANVYELWSGEYGYCDSPNGEFSIPSDAKVLQAFTILTALFLFFSVVLGAGVRAGGGKSAQTAGMCSFLAMISAIVSFSTVVTNEASKDLIDGDGYLPFEAIERGQLTLVAVGPLRLYYGPAFISMIVIFILTLFTTCTYCGLARQVEQEELDGGNDYGGAESNQAGESLYKDGAQTQDLTGV